MINANHRRTAPASAPGAGGPGTWRKKPLAAAISAAISAAVATTGGAAAAEIETVVVTATKREESAQDVTVSVQAVTGDTVRELGIETFDEYAEYLPNVVSGGNGPGKREIYIRGSATEQSGVTVAAAQGSAPGVALYVDEQPVSFGGRNLDVFAADLERIEVLSGPQGTLFGASSQSGNLRLITRKPEHGKFDAGFNTRFATTADGANSAGADGFVNLPLSTALALRVVVYGDGQGGWVDNIPATFTPSGEVVDRNNVAGYGPLLTGADNIESARNDAIVQNDWNEATYRGGRFGLAYAIDENWDALVQHSHQTLEGEGSFVVDTSLDQDHASARFSPEYNRDSFGLTTWTLTGRIANLDVIYTGGSLNRDVDSIIDYTHYNNGGGYITYYLCSGNIYDTTGIDPNNCYDPTKQYTEDTRNSRFTNEFRVTTDPAKGIRLLGGVYTNSFETNHLGDFQYAATNDAFAEHISSYHNNDSGDGFLLGNTTLPTAGTNAGPEPRSPLTVLFNDYTRTAEETALFGEVAVDLNGQWTVSFSARYYDLTTQLRGASNFSFGCRYGIGGNALRTPDGRCNGNDFSNDVTLRLRTLGRYAAGGGDGIVLNALSPNGDDGSPRDMFRGGGSNAATLAAIKNGHLSLSGLRSDGSINETDTIIKASVGWTPNDSMLLFATYAEGYRPAAQNRNAGQLSTNQSGVYENYVVPATALTDEISSFEVGMKGDFLDNSLRLNATYFRTAIDELQVSRFDPSNVAFLFFIENIGDAGSSGLELDLQWAAGDNLTLAGAASFLTTELTRLNPQLNGIAVPVGSELPFAPAFSGNFRARYDFTLDALQANAYFRGSIVYRGENVSGIVGSAEFMDDTLFRQSGRYSGLELQDEGGTYGTIAIPGGLPRNTRFVNPAATTLNVAFGVEKEGWGAEFHIDNLGDEPARIMQIAGHYTPVVSEQRPRTMGMRFSFELQ